jgi:hypothetical protein
MVGLFRFSGAFFGFLGGGGLGFYWVRWMRGSLGFYGVDPERNVGSGGLRGSLGFYGVDPNRILGGAGEGGWHLSKFGPNHPNLT